MTRMDSHTVKNIGMVRIIALTAWVLTACLARSQTWQSLGLPGRVVEFAAHPQHPALMYATSGGTWVFRSDDSGHTWRTFPDLIPTAPPIWWRSTTALGLDPADTATVFVGTGYDETSTGIGLYKTTNGGATWAESDSGIPPSATIRSIRVNPANHLLIYCSVVGSGAGVYRSRNGGRTWSAALATGGDPGVITIDPANPSSMMAVNGSGTIYTSTDTGNTWASNATSKSFYNAFFAGRDEQSGTLYIASRYNGIFRSTDGHTFNQIDLGVVHSEDQPYGFAIDQASHTLYASLDHSGVYQSTDGGATWLRCSTPVRSGPMLVTTQGVWVSTAQGFYRTLGPGQIWTPMGEKMGLARVFDVEASKKTPGLVFAGTDAGVYRSTDSGEHWQLLLESHPSLVDEVALDPQNDSVVYAGLDEPFGIPKGLYRTTDQGVTWSNKSPYAGIPVTSLFVQADTSTNIFLGSPSMVWKSTDRGEHWEALLSRAGASETQVVRVARSDSRFIYAGVSSNNVDLCGMFITENEGFLWERRVNGFPESIDARAVLSLDVHPSNPRMAWAGSWSDGIYRTTDAGLSWMNTTPGVEGNHRDLKCDPNDPTKLYALLCPSEYNFPYGILKSNDSGSSWEQMAFDGAYCHWPISIEVLPFPGETIFYLGTDGGGIFRARVIRPDAVEPGSSLPVPDLWILEQNFPNPFNSTTTIRYDLPARSDVLLTVFNALGQRVATLVQGEEEAGYYEVRFDATGLSSGVYLYRLTAGNSTQSRKLLVLR